MTITPRSGLALVALALPLAAGCISTTPPPEAPDAGPSDVAAPDAAPPDAGPGIDPSAPLLQQVAQARGLSLDAFRAGLVQPVSFTPGYVANQAAGMDLIQASNLALGDTELATLDQRGFVISERQAFPSFALGYVAIYAGDLPLFISADSILHAVHRSYDHLLEHLERNVLREELRLMLDAMREALADGWLDAFDVQTRLDCDVYLGVAASLLAGEVLPPVFDAHPTDATDPGPGPVIADLYERAQSASGLGIVELFGVARRVDFSQFTPRGHYASWSSTGLPDYFRAMMWLGRIDLRLLETQSDNSQVFHRRQLDAAFALRLLLQSELGETRWRRLDTTLGAFVGEPDSMTLPQLDALLQDLGVDGPADTLALDDATLEQALRDGSYGQQRIASHVMINGLDERTMPLSAVFLLLGQRYVVDSHVLANVVYDRVNSGATMRMMPDPLDVAYAALGNDQAAHLLADELERWGYHGDLQAMRLLVDAHDDGYWEANLYNSWMKALRALSPRADELADPAAVGLPSVVAGEAWGRRVLNTQLASWAELRHDTVLYAKQSYTGSNSCEFPDAYVEPVPAFFEALERYAELGQEVLATLDFGGREDALVEPERYLEDLRSVSAMLAEMARYQRAGEPFTEAHMAFVNDAVSLESGCGIADFTGWYARLHLWSRRSFQLEPAVADVHTQPTDEAGVPVGRVLHAGSGLPRLMVVTVETCQGPRAYAGLASSYYEHVTEDFDRLDDQRWESLLLGDDPPAPVEWMHDLMVE